MHGIACGSRLRLLIVTYRVSLAHKIAADAKKIMPDMACYDECRDELIDGQHAPGKLVIQLDSLWLLQHIPVYDVVVLDEMSNVLLQLESAQIPQARTTYHNAHFSSAWT